VVLKVNGNEVASGVVPVSAPLGFTANDCLDFGIDLGSPVGLEVLRSGAVQVQRHDRRRTCGIHRLPRAVTAGENANRWTDASSGLNRLLRRRNSGRTPIPDFRLWPIAPDIALEHSCRLSGYSGHRATTSRWPRPRAQESQRCVPSIIVFLAGVAGQEGVLKSGVQPCMGEPLRGP
jgi:hypothetical protein